jgi:hypothetical protein
MIAGAGTSQAQDKHAMSGTWEQHRGSQPIPIAGGGVMGGSGSVILSGASPATIKIPASRFGGIYAAKIPLTFVTSLVQLTTAFTLAGPVAAASLKQDAWMASRQYLNFAFCPGNAGSPAAGAPANPNCVDQRSTGGGATANQGTKHGLVRYTGGTGRFGGTMQMAIKGSGSLSKINAATPSKRTHQLIGGGVTLSPQAIGGGYNVPDLDILAGGPVTTGGVIGTDGLIIPPGGNVVGTGAGANNLNRGFAWTTGTVYVHGTNAGAPAPPTKETIVGSDQRVGVGVGSITLVAGAVTSRLADSTDYLSYDTVSMHIGHRVPTVSTLGYVIIAALMLGTAGFMLRRQEA